MVTYEAMTTQVSGRSVVQVLVVRVAIGLVTNKSMMYLDDRAGK